MDKVINHDDVAVYVDPKKRWPLVIIIMAALIGNLLFGYGLAPTMMAIGTEMNALHLVAWLFTASNIVQMVMNPLLPGISAKIPMTRLILISLIVGCVSIGLFLVANSMALLIFARALAGFSGAVIFNGGLALAGQIMPPEKRSMVVALQMVFNGIGSLIAPVVAGMCVDAGSWKTWAAITLAAFLIVTILYAIVFPKDIKAVPGAKIDVPGVVLLAVIFLALALLLQMSGTYWAWLSPITFILAIVVIAALIAFVKVELNKEKNGLKPAFRVTLFKFKPFTIATLCAMLACVGTNGIATYSSAYGQTVLGMSATSASVGYSIGSALCVVLSLLNGYLFGKKRLFKPMNSLGIILEVAVMLLLVATGANLPASFYILLIAIFAGSTAWVSSVNFTIGQMMVATEDVMDATAGIVSMQMVGAFLGVSLCSALINAGGYTLTFIVCSVFSVANLIIMLFLKDPAKQKG